VLFDFKKTCFKNGDKSHVSNYRPISLLSGFSRIFELLIFDRIEHHLVSNNILANKQFGFHDNVSIESASFKLIESIFSAWNNKEYTMGLFGDLTTVFDSASHEILILNLEFYGVKDSVLNWLKSYLHKRKQRVCGVFAGVTIYYVGYCRVVME